MATSPTARTLADLRAAGYRAQVVERWCQHSNRRIDLFGFVDIVALRPGEILAVQATSTANLAARMEKIKTECREAARLWLKGGGFLSCVGWRKYKQPLDGKYWRPTWKPITLDDIEAGLAGIGGDDERR